MRRCVFLLAVFVVLASFLCTTAQAQGAYTNLHEFSGGAGDGKWPWGSLIQGGSSFYGMTYRGGVNEKGVIFRMATDGTGYTNLHEFAGGTSDGQSPSGSLLQDGPTILRGMTGAGGANGGGVIFSIGTDGSGYTKVHEFAGGAGDGAVPGGSLVQYGGYVFGTTCYGGAADEGVVFGMAAGGSGYNNLHEFSGGASDGKYPQGSLIHDHTTRYKHNYLYGMTQHGGANDKGVIFFMNESGSGYANRHEFSGGAGDGAKPYGSLIRDGSTMHGMTYYGGATDHGVIFSMETDGSGYTNLHEFSSYLEAGDGAYPEGSLTRVGSTLYGMTSYGGAHGKGVIFSIDVSGTDFVTLHEFSGGAGDGANPRGSLIFSDDTLYGMTFYGGADDKGVIFAYNTVVPEPNVLLLITGGILSLLTFVRTKKNSNKKEGQA